MKVLVLIFASIGFVICLNTSILGQVCTGNIIYTSCPAYVWSSADGYLPGGIKNDTPRLQRIIDANPSKIVFDEAEYNVGTPSGTSLSPSLSLKSYRILEGTGRSSYLGTPIHLTSKIVQRTNNQPIFKIGTLVFEVSIRDLALVGGANTTGTIGILAQGNCVANCSSNSFQFSNLKFSGLDQGIFVNATDPAQPNAPVPDYDGHQWQFDNVRLDHSSFENCRIGIHVNSHNSGWNISSISFFMPQGAEQGNAGITTDPATNEDTTGKSYGVFFERSAYSSINLLIGNGPTSAGPDFATALVYVKQHGNLSIQSTVAEGFHDDVIVHGITRNSPINLMNNTFLNGVRINNATVFSSSNQYASFNDPAGAPAVASGFSQIYSMGDKFCAESNNNTCDEGRSFSTVGNDARVIFSSTQVKNSTQVPSFMKDYVDISRNTYPCTPGPGISCNPFRDIPNLSVLADNFSNAPLFRLGIRGWNYDFTRSEADGKMNVLGNQNNYSGYAFKTSEDTNYDGVTDKINQVTINNNGSVTLGSVNFSALSTADNGTLIYCSNCQKTTPCSGGGNGAIAKRINGSWDCD